GDGSVLAPVRLRQDFHLLLVVPDGVEKTSTTAVYAAFDARAGADGYAGRRAAVLDALRTGDLAALPANDLASSPLAAELRGLGAFRADVSGAGPAVYGLFADIDQARAAAARLRGRGRTWVVPPAW